MVKIKGIIILAMMLSGCWGEIKEKTLERILKSYDSNLLPTINSSAVKIKVKIVLLGMKSVEKKTFFQHYNMDFLLQQSWLDKRLKHNNSRITLSGDSVDLIWSPDTRVIEEKIEYPTKILKSNKLAHIDPDGTIVASQRCSLVNYCDMKFDLFPFDTQTCTVTLESFSYNNGYISLRWMEVNASDNFDVYGDPGNEQFKLSAFKTYNDKILYAGNGSGQHDLSKVKLKFRRPILVSIIRLYLPIQMIVFLSWLSFWIDFRSVPARSCIGITTVLTFVQVRMHIFKNDIPTAKGINVYDIYSLICFVFVFMAFLEYAWVQSMDMKYRLQDWYRVKKNNPDADLLDYEDTVENTILHDEDENQKQHLKQKKKNKFSLFAYLDEQHSIYRERHHILDQYSKWIFPALFFIVGITYTVVIYFSIEGDPDSTFTKYPSDK